MPPKSSPDKEHAKQKISLERLMHKRNINFYPLDDPLPPSLQRESNAVQAIEDATYEENWQRSSHGTKKRTNAILEAVLRCLENKSNEDDWRHKVEAKILGPLTKHPACPQCSKRLWRADFEFPIGDEHGERWDKLRRRRSKRKSCTCASRAMENYRSKTPFLKSSRGKTVQYEPDLESRVPKGLRPDLVVGLFNNRKMREILEAPARRDPQKRVGAVIKSDIFTKEDAAVENESGMVFPFLILEAKGAKAADSLEDMERQMALPAYELLRTQKRLLDSSTAVQANDRLPRVWLVSFKAQIWKLYVATVQQDEDYKDAYNIYNVWSGDVSGKRGALKLVLLLHCVFDWALDIYRLDIHERLQSMVDPDSNISAAKLAPSVSEISDNLGKMALTPHIGNLETITEEVNDVIKYKQGWVRDARRVLISGGGLLITATNIADIFDNFEHPDHAKRFARLVLQLLRKEPWYFPSESILDRVREEWTNEKHTSQQILERETPIYMQLEVYAYLDLEWAPTRKLTFVAATEDSIPELFARTQDATGTTGEYPDKPKTAEEQMFLEPIRDLRGAYSASSNLKEARSRWHHRLSGSNDELEWTPASMPSCDKAFEEIFWMYHVGRIQPSESFLKIWMAQPAIISESKDRSCLVVGHTDERDWYRVDGHNRAPRLCIFVYEDLDELETHRTMKTLRYYEEQAAQELGCDYTVLRGKYLSGSTHFDDNRPDAEYISPWGTVFPRDVRGAMRPSPESLIDEWIQALKNGRTDHAGSDEEEYYTDDTDRRGDADDSLEEEEEDNSDEDTDTDGSEPEEEEEHETEDSSEDEDPDTDSS